MRKFSVLMICVLSCATMAKGESIIDVGWHLVPRDAVGFEIPLFIQGDDFLTDMVFRVHIGDGGSEVGGTVFGPAITGLNYIGTIWETAHGSFTRFPSPGLAPGDNRQIVEDNVSLNVSGESVLASGVFVTLLVDTTGVPDGIYPLNLTGLIMGNNFNTEMQRQPNNGSNDWLVIENGIIEVPEPMSMSLLGLGSLALFRRRK